MSDDFPVARGEAMFSYALSEPEAGSDAAAMKTKAVRSDDGYVLNGVKRWITNVPSGLKYGSPFSCPGCGPARLWPLRALPLSWRQAGR